MDNIKLIKIIFDNGDEMTLEKNSLNDFYVTNLDNKGDETPYEQTIINNKLYANFFLINLKKITVPSKDIKRIKGKKDINEIDIIFNNKKYIKFEVPSTIKPFDNVSLNDYEYVFEDDNKLGILLSKYNIKYKDNLFIWKLHKLCGFILFLKLEGNVIKIILR